MATFQIFEDRENPIEKENRVVGGAIKMGVGKPGMEKRTTLALLNNVIDQNRGDLTEKQQPVSHLCHLFGVSYLLCCIC